MIDLPEAVKGDLVPADEGDSLDAADRARLHGALQKSADQLRAGQGIQTARVLDRLK